MICNAKFLLHNILICFCSRLKAAARGARAFQGPRPSSRRDASAPPSAAAGPHTVSAGEWSCSIPLSKALIFTALGVGSGFLGVGALWNEQKTDAAPPAAEGCRNARGAERRQRLFLPHPARRLGSARRLWGWRAQCPLLPPGDLLVSHPHPPRHRLSGNWCMDLLSSHPARPPPGRERRNVFCLPLATSGTRSKISHLPEFAHLELKPTGRFSPVLLTLSAMSSRI